MAVTSPPGQVLRDDGGMRLEFVRRHDRSVQEVWAALTEPDLVARWFGRWTGDPASGTVQVHMTEEEDATPEPVTVVACEPPTRLLLEMPTPDGTWSLAVTLTEQEGGAGLRFVQRLAEPYDAGSIGPGWHFYLDRLGAVVAGTPVPEDWEEYYPALQDVYALPA